MARSSTLNLIWPNIYPINTAEYVASQLAEVGITVDIQTVEFSVWLEQVYGNTDYDMTAVLHVEPRDIGNYANPDYYWHYDNPEVQELIDQAKVAPSPEEANDLLKQAARQISEDSPVDWLILHADLTVSTQRRHRVPDQRHRPRGSTPPGSPSSADTEAARGRRAVIWFIARRLGLLVVALLVTSIVIFVLLRLLPGDLARVLGGTEASPERIRALRGSLGLDRSLVAPVPRVARGRGAGRLRRRRR